MLFILALRYHVVLLLASAGTYPLLRARFY